MLQGGWPTGLASHDPFRLGREKDMRKIGLIAILAAVLGGSVAKHDLAATAFADGGEARLPRPVKNSQPA